MFVSVVNPAEPIRRVLIRLLSPQVSRVAGYLTPVPGGVGPLTVAMLIDNTFRNALRFVELQASQQPPAPTA